MLKRKCKPCGKYVNHENINLVAIETPLGKYTPLTSYITGLIPYSSDVWKVFEDQYDLIHYHNVSLFGPQIFKMGKAPKIYTAHDHWLICPFNDFYTWKKICKGPGRMKCQACLLSNKRPPQLWRLYGLRMKMDKIILPSNYLKNTLEKHGFKGNFTVIQNFVPDAPHVKAQKKGYYFFAGQLEEKKGIVELMNVFKGTGQKLIIAGTGSLKNKVVKECNGNISYAGFLSYEEIYKHYAEAKAFILPSQCPENAPLTILEAMSVGTPSISSDRGGSPEMVGKLSKSLIFHDFAELKVKIENFKGMNPKKVRKVFDDNYNVKAYVKRYLELVRQ
jgi:glycosyltransferase involved in cell wall biosynthesis